MFDSWNKESGCNDYINKKSSQFSDFAFNRSDFTACVLFCSFFLYLDLYLKYYKFGTLKATEPLNTCGYYSQYQQKVFFFLNMNKQVLQTSRPIQYSQFIIFTFISPPPDFSEISVHQVFFNKSWKKAMSPQSVSIPVNILSLEMHT